MTDRELLELAAKAAGIKWEPEDTDAGKECELRFGLWLCIDHEPSEFTRRRFNPLHDDGDALRLAAKLKLSIHTDYADGVANACSGEPYFVDEDARHYGDTYAAVRLAIVRAAAEIGRAMT